LSGEDEKVEDEVLEDEEEVDAISSSVNGSQITVFAGHSSSFTSPVSTFIFFLGVTSGGSNKK